MLIRFFQRKWLKVIQLDLTALFFMFFKKLNGKMRHLCPVSDEKAKQRYSRSGVSKLRPVKPFYPAREGISFGRIDILSMMKNNIFTKHLLIYKNTGAQPGGAFAPPKFQNIAQ